MDAVAEAWSISGNARSHSEVEALIYPQLPTRDAVPMQFVPGAAVLPSDEARLAEFEQRVAGESQKSFEAGRQRGFQEGMLTERDTQAMARNAEETQRREQMTALVQSFDEERERYLHAVEPEVVELALAIAARILRREAQMDPLLLTGAVRVALGQLAEGTQVRLCVPAKECDLWREAIEHLPNLRVKPAVVSDDKMRLGDCVVETELGSVDLGVRAQLGEIERGFFDGVTRRLSGSGMARSGNVSEPDAGQ
jgi:flagellar assembly protein FliH